MDQEKFLQELEEIRTGYNVGSREFSSRVDGSSACNRLYNALLECLAVEADHVEAKLKVLTTTLCFYVDLRIRQDAISPEADAFGHFLFMECSRLVLGLQFHHLENTDPYKASFKSAISDVYTRLQEFAIGQVFVVLEWLMVNQWSHPTLVAMMKGEEIEKERALNFIRSGEYPELFRLRVEMLMQSGCDNFASNLVSWCIQSPLFESDVPLRSTHLLLLQKLGKFTHLQNQCYQMNCCLAREVIKYMEDRLLDDASFLLSLSYNFFLIDWVKPANFCCTKNLLESWLKIQRQKEPDIEKFMDSVSKVVSLAQNVRQLNIMLEALVNLFDTQFIQFCSELAINSIQKFRQLQQMQDGFCESLSLSPDAVSGLVQICRIVAKLYQNHPQIHLSCLTSALCLEPTEESYRCLENAFRISPPSLCSYDVTSTFPAILDVSPNTFSLLLESIDSLRPPNLHPQLGWDVLVKSLLPNFEANLDDGNLLTGIIDGAETDGTSINRFNFCDDGLGSKEVEMESVSCMLDQESLVYPPDGIVSPSLTHQVLNDDTLTGDQDIDGGDGDGDGVLFQRHCHQEILSGDDAYRYHDDNLSQGVGKNILNNITLDDIQQVLSGSTLGNSGKEAPMDERALQEITAFLQSEMGKNSSALGFDSSLNQSQMNEFLQSPDLSYLNSTKSTSPPPYYAAVNRSHHCTQSSDTSQSRPSAASAFADQISPPPNMPTFEESINPPTSESKSHIGANILVTDSNFPYLKQFLPHLQTVMQSVQSLVRCTSSSNNIDACANSRNVMAGSLSHQVVHSSTCSSLSSSATFPSSIASNDTQDVPSPSNSPQFLPKESHVECSSPHEPAVASMMQPQSMQTSSSHSSIEDSPQTAPSPFEDASKPLLKCDFCNKEFISKAGRTTHILRVHSRNKKTPLSQQPGLGLSLNSKIVTSSMDSIDLNGNKPLDLNCSTLRESSATSSQQVINLPADSSANTNSLKHCFVKIVRLDKDSQQQDHQGHFETDALPMQTSMLKNNDGCDQSLNSDNEGLLQQMPEASSPHCMCESCGEMFVSQEMLTNHTCDCEALINAQTLTAASVHSTTNPLQNLDIFDRSNQIYEESLEPGASKLPVTSHSSGAGNQKIVFLVNSNLQSNALGGVLQSNQSKMQAFLRTLKIPNTCNQPSQTSMALSTITTSLPLPSSPAASLSSPKNIPAAIRSPQPQKNIQHRLQLHLHDSPSKAINLNDKQTPFIEMLKLADHFLKSNSLKVAQQMPIHGFSSANPPVKPFSLQETLHVLSIPHNNSNNALEQMKLLSNNQKLLHVINKTNLTIPQLKVALQGNVVLNNGISNATNAQVQSTLQAKPLKLEIPGKEVQVEGIKMVEQVEYSCESCLLTFSELDAASQHVSSSDHRTSNIARYFVYCCPYCGVKYKDKMTVKNHIILTCPNSIKPLSDIFALNKFNNITVMASSNSMSDNALNNVEGQVGAADNEFKGIEMRGSSERVVKQEPELSFTSSAKSLSLCELVNSPITMVSLLKQPSQVQPLQQLHKCHFCLKMFSSAEYLNLHVSTRHQVVRPVESEGGSEQNQESTSTMIKHLILKSSMVVTASSEVKNVIPTPSAVSVPTLEQLTMGFKHTPSEKAQQTTTFASLNSRPEAFSLEGKTLQNPSEISGGQSTSATPKQGVINIPVIGNQKNFPGISNLQNVSQLPSLVPHPPKTSKAKGILYKNVYMQCEGTYYCSVCKVDLSSRESKRNHRQLACGDPKTVTYSRKYFYLCPYCSEKFPSQKECRHHQVTECLPMIGVSTDELTVKELACPLCPKKYHNLIPLKGHMTQVHHLPKSETRKMLEGLGYLETAFDQHILANASAVSSSSFGIFNKTVRNMKSCNEEPTSAAEVSQPPSQPTRLSSSNMNLTSSCSSMDLFDLDPDMSSDVNSDMPCDVIYSKESSVMFSPEDSDDRSKKDSCFEDYDINSTLLNIDNSATPNSFLNEPENSRKLQTPTLLSQASFDESPSSWSSPSPNISSSLQLPSSSSIGFRSEDQPLSCSSFTADSTLSPEQKRRRNSNSSKPAEFFTMMFRNYPILAKGVYVCSACQSQMTCNAEADRHATECTAQKNGKPIEIKRSTLFKCTHCTATFWKAKLCRQHQIESCLSEAGTSGGGSVDLESLTMPSVACPLCSVRSYNRSGLMSHMKYKHGMDTKGVREIMEKCGIRKQTPERFGASTSLGNSSTVPLTSESAPLTSTISTIPDVFSMSVAASSIVSSDSSHPVATSSTITSSLGGSSHGDGEEISERIAVEPDIPVSNEPLIKKAPSLIIKSNSITPSTLAKQTNENKRKFGSIIGSMLRNSKKEKLTISLKSSKRPAEDVKSSHMAFNSSPGISDSSSDDLQKPPMAKKKPEELSSATVAQSIVC